MAGCLRNIVLEGDEVLRKQARDVSAFNDKLGQLLDDMLFTMYAAEGVGLAAPQIGILRKIVVIDIGEGVIELVNPEIIEASEETEEDVEGCLSCPDVSGYVRRPVRVTVRAQDRNGEPFELMGEGLLARALCHEIDHLSGRLFIDIMTERVDESTKKRDRKAKRNRT